MQQIQLKMYVDVKLLCADHKLGDCRHHGLGLSKLQQVALSCSIKICNSVCCTCTTINNHLQQYAQLSVLTVWKSSGIAWEQG